MTDRSAIKLAVCEVISSYAVFLDAGEFERVAGLFAEDAVMDISPPPGFMEVPISGRAAIVAALEARYHEVRLTGGRRHVCSNTIFECLSESSCSTRTFLTSIATFGDRPPELLLTGEYADRLELIDGSWRFIERRLTLDVPGSGAPK